MNYKQTLRSRLAALGMELLPHHFLNACMHEATRCRFRPWKNWQIRWFVQRYRVNLDEAQYQDASDFTDFNDFFTRALRADARPIDYGEDTLVCPADGQLSSFGSITHNRLFQAKGKAYALSALLGGDIDLARHFEGGRFLTVYLSPRDYHRVHMPVSGELRQMIHVPGRLFSVNSASAAHVNQLFARNERVISLFDTSLGSLAVILVGALFVGNIEQVWSGPVTPAPGAELRRIDYSREAPIRLAQGEEMGRFNMGSTVVLLLGNQQLDWRGDLTSGQDLRLGQTLTRR